MELKHTITLVGNPNTGKSTVFNALTGLKQHTGNWTGKTVGSAAGEFNYKDQEFVIIDLPGIYSVNPVSPDEKAAMEFMTGNESEATIVVLDGSCLERNLILALQIIDICENVIVCVNLIDEAKRKKIDIDLRKLSDRLGVRVVGTSARDGKGLEELKEAVYDSLKNKAYNKKKSIMNRKYTSNSKYIRHTVKKAESIYYDTVVCNVCCQDYIDRKIDNIIMSKRFGIPIMLFILGFIFWLTIVGANYPSKLLRDMFNTLEAYLVNIFEYMNIPLIIKGVLLDGVFRTLAWVVSVMLPPMAIFFPLFTFFEDLGLLPRIAFNLDRYFKKAKAHGKQALTMCMDRTYLFYFFMISCIYFGFNRTYSKNFKNCYRNILKAPENFDCIVIYNNFIYEAVYKHSLFCN